MKEPYSDNLQKLRQQLLRILFSRLVAPLMLLVVVVACIVGYVGYLSIEKLQSQRVQAIALAAEKYCQNGAGMLEAMAGVFPEEQTDEGYRLLSEAWRAYGFFDSIYYLDGNGRIRYIAPYDSKLIGMDLSGLSDLDQAKRSRNVIFSRPYISLNTKAPTIPMILSVRGNGYMVGELNLSVLQEQIQSQTGLLPQGTVYIMDKNGTLLGHPDYQLVREQTNWARQRMYQVGKNADVSVVFLSEGVLYMGSTHRVAGLGWIVVEQVPLRILILPYFLGLLVSSAFIMLIQIGVVRTLRQNLSGTLVEPLFDRAEAEVGFRKKAEAEALEKEKMNLEMIRINRKLEDMNTELNRANEELNREVQERIRAKKELERTNEQLYSALEALKETQGQMILQEKMAALGSLVAGITHEINTPVGVGVTVASFLEKETHGVKELLANGRLKREDFMEYLGNAQESVGLILNNLMRADELIGSFKTMAVNQSSDQMSRFDVRQFMDETLNSLRPKWKKTRHQVLVQCPEGLTMYGYPGALAQIITNLILNSLTHGFENQESGIIRIEFKAAHDGIEMRYQDDGIGLDPNAVKDIYTPFFTTKRNQGGTGLGMYIVYNLVTQQFGGDIQCSSSLGAGVEFVIFFPGKNTDGLSVNPDAD